MKITILCTDVDHPVNRYLKDWKNRRNGEHDIDIVRSAASVKRGDILFLISCNEIVDENIRGRYKVCLVIHASDLPRGRGMSPHIWQILENKSEITVTLLEAADKVDSGAIWNKKMIKFQGHELYDEINHELFNVEVQLMDLAINNFKTVQPQEQNEVHATYYKRRTPKDSRIDPNKSIKEQFNALRVADPKRYPAFFDYRGHRYKIEISKMDKEK